MASLISNGLYVERLGAGKPVLLMHGGLGLDHTYFRPWLEDLAQSGYELILYDHRGNGRSARPADFGKLDHDAWSDDAAQLIRDLGLGKPVVLGHSYGSFLAQSFALKYPDRLSALILSNAAPALDYIPVIQANAARKALPGQMPAVIKALTQPAKDDAEMRATWNSIVSLYFHTYDLKVGLAMDQAMRYSADGYNAGNRCLATFNTTARLGEIKVPTLLLSGDDDWITPVKEGGERLRAGIPGAVLEVFKQSGHFPFIEERARFVKLVGEFLDALE